MVFSSSIFLFLFLPIVLAGYYLLSRLNLEFRNIWLLFASLFFYFWGEPHQFWVILTSIVLNYLFGLLIHFLREKPLAARRIAIALAVAANLGILFYFKYLDFAIDIINNAFHTAIPYQDIILPIGISFFTFQGMTYVIDLYWGNTKVQKNPLKIALYISLFPQLIAGPIVRYKDVAEQISARTVTLDKFHSGCVRFVIGLGKKVILANTTAEVVDKIFAQEYFQHSVATAWLGIVCYAVQIYFDFSGYSDMAIGLGRMFGFEFLENFNFPYISKSITEFWRRWHISLSSFFRDYVYIPLGGNRKGNVYLHLLAVFFLTGLWHGASWNFIVWGLWHGLIMMIERPLIRRGKKDGGAKPAPAWLRVLQHGYTLLLALVGWVFFRADDLSYALGYLKIMFGLQAPQAVGFSAGFYLTPYLTVILLLAFVACTPIVPKMKTWLTNPGRPGALVQSVPVLQTVGVLAVFAVAVMMVITSSYNPFIYFRF